VKGKVVITVSPKRKSRCNDLTIQRITPQHATKHIFIRVDASGARLWNEFAPSRTAPDGKGQP